MKTFFPSSLAILQKPIKVSAPTPVWWIVPSPFRMIESASCQRGTNLGASDALASFQDFERSMRGFEGAIPRRDSIRSFFDRGGAVETSGP